MPSSVMPARHRAEARSAAGFSELARAVTSNATGMGRQAAVIVAASGLVLSSGVAANAADVQPQRDVAASSISLASARTAVVAPAEPVVSFNRTAVKVNAKPVVAPQEPVAAAPVVEAPVAAAPVAPAPVAAVEVPVAVQAAAPVATQAPAPVAAPAAAAAPVAPAPAPAAPAAPAASSGVAATIAAAAKGQLGVTQDCTRLASNSLAAAGINFHGWPAGYLSLGRTVSAGEAIPGDLIYYADGGMGMAHIAVYIGGGQAVHGGFNGNSTVIAPAELGSGGVYIRVGG